jgi:hypothetical protein
VGVSTLDQLSKTVHTQSALEAKKDNVEYFRAIELETKAHSQNACRG